MRRTLAVLAAIVLTRRSGHGPVKVPGMVRPGRPMKLELRRAGNDRQDRRDVRWFRRYQVCRISTETPAR